MRGWLVAALVFVPALARAQATGDEQPNKGGGDEDQAQKAPPRVEPNVLTPADPLQMSPEVRSRIGSDAGEMPPPATGELKLRIVPYYEESRGDYRLRTVPPFWLEHARGIGTQAGEDRQSLYGLLYYQRRSRRFDTDLAFPLFFHHRDGDDRTTVLGPVVHRQTPESHDNWVFPLVFEGKRKDGGYLHAPLVLMTSHWNSEGAFTIWGPYFRNRTGNDVDSGFVPLWFHGESGDIGGRKNYSLAPPLAFYHRESELEQSSFTVAGPVIIDTDPKRAAYDVVPIFFHVRGRPETGGIRESHTTLFPLFHYGNAGDRSLLWVPGYLRRITPDTDTLITPFYSHALTRNGDEGLRFGGPIVPLFFDYRDKRLQSHAWAIAPLYYQSSSKRGFDVMTPLFGRFESYGISKTTWVFPTLVHSTDESGYETDVHPLLYIGRSGTSSHAVLAPLYWDFKTQSSRATVAFPLVWRFSYSDQTVTQVTGNVVYLQKPVVGGLETQTHIAPFFSWGSSPNGYFWNVLFGLAGYSKDGDTTTLRALWIPIQIGGPKKVSKN